MAELLSELQHLSVSEDGAGRSKLVTNSTGSVARVSGDSESERNAVRSTRAAARSEDLSVSALAARIRATAAESRPRTTKLLAATELAMLPAPERNREPVPPHSGFAGDSANGEAHSSCDPHLDAESHELYRQRVAAFFNPIADDARPNKSAPASSSSVATGSTAAPVASRSAVPVPASLPPHFLVGDIHERTTEPLPGPPVSAQTRALDDVKQSTELVAIAENDSDEETLEQQRSFLASPD